MKVVLNVNATPRILTYIPLYLRLKKIADEVVLLFPPGTDVSEVISLGVGENDILFLESDRLSEIKGLDVFVSAESTMSSIPNNCVAIGLIHSLPLKGELNFDYSTVLRLKPNILLNFDYLILPIRQEDEFWCPHRYERHVRGVVPDRMKRSSRLGILQGGYPKIDFLKNQFAQRKSCGKYIIYSPTNANISGGEVLKYGELIISVLLNEFPDKTVVFRPYPGNLIPFISSFKENSRFIIDNSETGLKYQKDAFLTVTDNSSSSITFSFSSLIPSIFVELEKSSLINGAGGEVDSVHKLGFGFHVRSISGFTAALKELKSQKDDWPSIINDFGAKRLANFQCASEAIADFIVDSKRNENPKLLWVSSEPSKIEYNAEKIQEILCKGKAPNRWQADFMKKIKEYHCKGEIL
ncbi:MAG: hypothetical protein LAT77_10610 [Aliidiomarina sp.]|uniref:hypothetical protein n=1 Tax=Aliidiomarina sp. TaxID=1872439 RepID=UPI0025C5AA4C|nr:hypothetical protein [Aliidiomarina sp.]MCH8502346.1 hypothetical protein [Aliidiomarina sp.]